MQTYSQAIGPQRQGTSATPCDSALPAQKVVVIHDAEYGQHGAALATSLGLEAIALLQPLQPGTLNNSDLVVDADLRNLKTVDDLRRLLAQSPRARLRVFLVQDGRRNRAARVQAEALGATMVMDRVKAARELLQHDIVPRLRPSLGSAGAKQSAQGRTVARAGEELAKLFEGVLGNQPIDMAALGAASEEILSGIGESSAASWLATVRDHHEGTFQHCLLVAMTAARYADHIGLGKAPATALLNAALLHDIGKALIPLSILDKPARLTDAEMQIVRRHPGDAHDYLSQQAIHASVLDAIRHHHEMLDGSGYPDGLTGNQVKRLTRVLTVCDVFAALSERRPYKETHTPAQALAVLWEMARYGKVDGAVVAHLAEAFEVHVGAAVDDGPVYRRS